MPHLGLDVRWFNLLRSWVGGSVKISNYPGAPGSSTPVSDRFSRAISNFFESISGGGVYLLLSWIGRQSGILIEPIWDLTIR